MKISQMRYFSVACHTGNITQAAEILHVSQPAVTMSIKALEDEFGIALLVRGKKSISPTSDGELFLKRCDSILQEFDSLSSDFHQLSLLHNTINVGMPPMIGAFLFPQIFEDFRRNHPEIHIRLTETGSETAKELVRKGELELALITKGNLLPTGLEYQTLTQMQLLYCVSSKHPHAHCDSIDIQTIGRDPLILFSSGYYHPEMLQSRFTAAGLEPNILFHSTQLLTIKSFVRQNLAGAFLIPQVIYPDDDIVGIPVSDPLTMDVAVIWRRDAYLTKESRRLIRYLESRFD